MDEFQKELQNLTVDQFTAGQMMPWDQGQNNAEMSRQQLGGFPRCSNCFRCFSCFNCFNCFRCSNCFRCFRCFNCFTCFFCAGRCSGGFCR